VLPPSFFVFETSSLYPDEACFSKRLVSDFAPISLPLNLSVIRALPPSLIPPPPPPFSISVYLKPLPIAKEMGSLPFLLSPVKESPLPYGASLLCVLAPPFFWSHSAFAALRSKNFGSYGKPSIAALVFSFSNPLDYIG